MQPHEVAALPLGVDISSNGKGIGQGTRLQAHPRLRPATAPPLRRNNPNVGKQEKQRSAPGEIACAPMENAASRILK